MGAVFEIKPGQSGNLVRFESKAALETFDGKTNRMQGRVTVDPAAVGDSVSVLVEVDLASLDTGIGKRNGHMRENHLETDKYPKAVFSGATILSPKPSVLEPGKPVNYDVEGSFALHGVTRRLRTTVEVTYLEEGGQKKIRLRTSFKVNLGHYNISRPSFLFLKLGEDQRVTFDAVAIAAE